MKKKYFIPSVIFLLLISLSSVLSCKKIANEIGKNSIVFYKNGQKYVPECYKHPLLSIDKIQDTLTINICINRNVLHYKLAPYHGSDTYYFDSSTQNKCYVDSGYSTDPANYDYVAQDNQKTYLRILTLDSSNKRISGIFEADLINTMPPNGQLKITKGRFDVYYQ